MRVGEIDASERVHFSVIKDRESVGVEDGEMSYFAFIHRFTRINSVEEACARIKHLGYVASRRVRIYGEEFELLSDPFPQADQIAIRAKAKSDSKRSDTAASSNHRAKWQKAATGQSRVNCFATADCVTTLPSPDSIGRSYRGD